MVNDSVNPNHIRDDSVASTRMTAQPPPSLAPKTAERTSLGHRFRRALAGGPNRRLPGLHPSPGGAASLSPFLNRRLTLPILALLALLTAGLLFLLPGGLLQAQENGDIMYAENGTDPVATFTGTDPEARMVYWSLAEATVTDQVETDEFEDHSHFSISSDGLLSFKFPPNHEMPRGTALDDDNTNTYNVVVVASDDALGAGTDDNPVRMAYKKVTVMVTDVDEMGMITLSAQQPQDSILLTATLTDGDAAPAQVTGAEWTWEHSAAAGGPWTTILTGTDSAYMPLGVVDKYLRVTATYTDSHGSDKNVMAVSANMVRAAPDANNAAPVFPDEDLESTTTVEVGRKVDENSPPGTNVGKPVVANDAPGDVLTYTLTGVDGDDGSYRIDQATGQITVGPRTTLNREDPDNTDFIHTVTVTATDPTGGPDGDTEQAVIITINDVNEAPTMDGGATRVSLDENTAIDIDNGVSTYTATDPEVPEAEDICVAANCTWSVSGTDAGAFEFSDTFGQLIFKEVPNYEKPVDSNKDNVYMVTVVVTDMGVDGKNKMTAMRDVAITVRNIAENGTVSLSSVQPKVGVPLTATITDLDGGVKDVTWKWYDAEIGDETVIADATSDTYTPVLGDVWRHPVGEGDVH